jgi:Ca2+-binding RTX toxin-like protein
MPKILGTQGNDSITSGTNGDDVFATSVGSDTILGTAGNDLINAGYQRSSKYWKMNWNDSDTIDYVNLATAYGKAADGVHIVVDLGAGTVQKYSGDTLMGTDTLVGADAVRGTGGNDVFHGRDFGWDYEEFRGGAGDDWIDGRGGFDGANYGNATGAISVKLAEGKVNGDASVGTDTLREIEHVIGSGFADTYDARGFSGASLNQSSSGDIFNQYAPGAGNDTIWGNGDTALNLGGTSGPLNLSLAGLNGLASTSTLSVSFSNGTFQLQVAGVNGLRGGSFNDTLVGGGHVNTDGSTNTLSGDASYERFRGGGGDDFIDGGTGLDRAEYNLGTPQSEGITVLLANGIVTGDALAVGTDTLRGIESVTGTYLDDLFDARGFTLSNATVASANSGDVKVGLPAGETLASIAFNEFRPLGGDDTVIGNGATRVNFSSMGVEQLTGLLPSVVATFSSASSGNIVYGLTDGGLGSVSFTGTYGLTGGNGNDVITGSSGFQELRGYWGDDTLQGGDGNDRLFGFNGGDTTALNLSTTFSDDDSLDGGNGDDLLRGDFGDDTLLGGTGNDTLDGGTGNDSLSGGDGNDFLDGSLGNDTLLGGNGDDRFGGGAGDDLIDGGANGSFGDTLAYRFAGAGVDVNLVKGLARGGGGNDTLIGIEHIEDSAYNDTLTGNASTNWFRLGGGNDSAGGGAGNDVVMYEDATAAVTVNLATGSASGASFCNDTLSSIEAAHGGGYAVVITLGNSASGSYVFARAGNDTLKGGSAGDVFIAGSGADVINGGGGFDTINYADDGNEFVNGKATTGLGVTVSLATGKGTDLWGDVDTISNVEALEGSALADTLTGDANANRLSGGAGKDTIAGGGGNDTIIGGAGQDSVTGGAGADVFVFTGLGDFNSVTATGADVATDFLSGTDHIDLTGVDANSALAGDQAFSQLLASGTAFTTAGQLRLDGNVLYGNTDGDAAAEFALKLTGVASLSLTDLYL